MAHGRGLRRAVPVLLARRAYNDIAGANLAFRAVLAFHPAAAGGHDQPLAEGMRVPGAARAGLEGDERGRDAGRLCRREQRIDADSASEPVIRAFAGGLRAASFKLHKDVLSFGATRGRCVTPKERTTL